MQIEFGVEQSNRVDPTLRVQTHCLPHATLNVSPMVVPGTLTYLRYSNSNTNIALAS